MNFGSVSFLLINLALASSFEDARQTAYDLQAEAVLLLQRDAIFLPSLAEKANPPRNLRKKLVGKQCVNLLHNIQGYLAKVPASLETVSSLEEPQNFLDLARFVKRIGLVAQPRHELLVQMNVLAQTCPLVKGLTGQLLLQVMASYALGEFQSLFEKKCIESARLFVAAIKNGEVDLTRNTNESTTGTTEDVASLLEDPVIIEFDVANGIGEYLEQESLAQQIETTPTPDDSDEEDYDDCDRSLAEPCV